MGAVAYYRVVGSEITGWEMACGMQAGVWPAGAQLRARSWRQPRETGRPGSLPVACSKRWSVAVLAALEQRTALRYTMPGMTSNETTSYVAHHLKIAGRPDQLFTEDALTLIHTTSRGYPRAVNNLVLQALVAALATGKNLVDEAAARASVSEVVGD